MGDQLLTFQKFKDPEIANDIADKLRSAGIRCEIEDDHKFFDPTFSRNPLQNEIRVKLDPADFSKATKVLDDYYRSQLDTVDKDYYLFDFTDEELLQILTKPDEWGPLDYQLAQKILSDRGKEITGVELQSLKSQRISELEKPERSPTGLIIAGYISAVLGGIFGLVIGWILSTTKRTLPDGQFVYTYNSSDRQHGRIISGIALLMLISVLFFSLAARYLNL